MVNPLVTDTPNLDQTPDPIEQDIPDLYPSCAVTRAMAKKATHHDNHSDINFSETFLGQNFDEDEVPLTAESNSDLPMSDQLSLRSKGKCHDSLLRSQLIQEQQTDPEILNMFHKSLNTDETSESPVFYCKKNGSLMRQWRPPDVSVPDDRDVKHEIVAQRHIVTAYSDWPKSNLCQVI